MLKANFHTHSKYCHHAIGDVKDYVLKAIDCNYQALGMSDHAPLIPNLVELYGEKYRDFKGNMSQEEMELYLADIEDAKKEFGNKIKIYSAFEAEFLPKGIDFYRYLRLKVDYLILGVHYFESNGEIISSYSETDMNYKTLHDYATSCIEGMESGLFSILAHPDLFMYKYKNINGERKFDETAIKESRRIIEASIRLNIPLELNANGLRSYGAKEDYHFWNYPYYEFWELVKEYKDVKIILGADAHNPDLLDCKNIDKVKEFAHLLKLKVLNI